MAGPGRLNVKKSLTSLGAKIAASMAAAMMRDFLERRHRDALSLRQTHQTAGMARA
jgi:hypothetical protein